MSDLTEITEAEFLVAIHMMYATDQNFTGAPIYSRSACYLHADAAKLLKRASGLAAAIGLKLLIWDAFRPSEAQWKLWNHTPNPEFLADPRRGSPHSMGAAVDLTLVDGVTGCELVMGTGFDEMTPASHHAVTTISLEAQRNRLVLLGIMTAAGFDNYKNEWWHYQLFDARAKYPVLSDAEAGTHMMEF